MKTIKSNYYMPSRAGEFLGEMEYISKTAMITKEQFEWLRVHESVNFSGFVREMLQKLMDGESEE